MGLSSIIAFSSVDTLANPSIDMFLKTIKINEIKKMPRKMLAKKNIGKFEHISKLI